MSGNITTIPPHGGILVQRVLEGEERRAALSRAARLPSLTLDPRGVADLGLLATGAYSPLTGFMTRADYLRVLHDMRLASGLPWSLPITLRVADGAALRDSVALKETDGRVVGLLDVRDVFRHSKEEEAELVYGTTDAQHPGVAQRGRVSDPQSGASCARIHPEGRARDGRRAAAASAARTHQGRRRPRRRARLELPRAAGALLPAGSRAARRLPCSHALRRSPRGRVPRAGAQELRLHPFHRGPRSRGRGQLLRVVRRAAHLRPLHAGRAGDSARALRAHVLLPALRRHGVAQDLPARSDESRHPVRQQSPGDAAERHAAAARVQPSGSSAALGGRIAGGGRMTWSTFGRALSRIRRLLRRMTAAVQPWDWDELPVRHWWDVYAK